MPIVNVFSRSLNLPAPQRPAGKWGAGGFSFSWCDEARALEHILRTLAGKDDRNDFRVADLAIYGQESNNTTWRLCKMNLAIRGIDGNIGPHNADTFHNDVHKDLKADFIHPPPRADP